YSRFSSRRYPCSSYQATHTFYYLKNLLYPVTAYSFIFFSLLLKTPPFFLNNFLNLSVPKVIN
ncbi:hypothetical protein NEOC65_001909, partial [Neochlamydia sp. AcF65]|nr:hypothetical protein [Neochlamydia sp. AcF65]